VIAILDYDAGNIKSVEKAIISLGETAVITRDRDTILKADKVILPGVGAFGDAMEKLKCYGLVEVINEVVENNTPFLGICLGLQLLFESSEETPGASGLGILKGNQGRLFKGIKEDSYVYFVHSYYLQADEPEIVTATTDYATLIHASVEKGNVFACQFHPEKSSDVGLQILRNFIQL
jgi:glutamine amidotransferase